MSSLTQKPGIKDRIRSLRTWIKVENQRHPPSLALLMERSKKGPGVPLPSPNSHGRGESLRHLVFEPEAK
jgi:hypothetical protein